MQGKARVEQGMRAAHGEVGDVGTVKRNGFFTRMISRVLVAYWSRVDEPVIPIQQHSPAPADNVQRAMNLIMPLNDRSSTARAELANLLASAADQIITGLNNVATVHFARFDLIDGNLCMLSIYDGDFTNYIRDFIVNIGDAFTAIMAFVENPPQVPVQDHVEEFIDWVERHDSYQIPDNLTTLGDDLVNLPRKFVLLMHQKPNVMLGVYRNYPGFSAAQIRERLSLGW